MKKLFTVGILGLLGTGAFAQTTQGTKVVAGSVGISRSQQEEENINDPRKVVMTNFSLIPSVGYFIRDGLELGATIDLSYSKLKHTSDKENNEFTSESTYKGIGFNPFIKKYFFLSDKVALTGAATAGFSVEKQRSEASYSSVPYEQTINRFQAHIRPGVTFFPTEKIGISATFGSLGYNYAAAKNENAQGKSVNSGFGLNLSSGTFGIGLSYHF